MTYSLLREIDYLLAPRGCAGCLQPDCVLCHTCQQQLDRWVERDFPSSLICLGALFSCARYQGPVRHAILTWKDHGDREVTQYFASALARLILRTLRVTGVSPDNPLVLIPAPSSRSSLRERGWYPMRELCTQLAALLSSYGFHVHVCCALRQKRGSHKSVTGSVRQRQSKSRTYQINRRQLQFLFGAQALCSPSLSLSLSSSSPSSPSSGSSSQSLLRSPFVMVIDDICTTGSTVVGCIRSLRQAGVPVHAAFTLASVSG